MDLMIMHFALPLFLFQAVYSEILRVWNSQKEIWSEIEFDEELEYGNTSLSSDISNLQELNLKTAQLKLEKLELQFELEMVRTLTDIGSLNLNMTKQSTKMLGDIEEVRYSVMKSMKEKNDLLNKVNSETSIFEVFYHLHVSELLKEECVTFLTQLQTLKYEIFRSDKECLSRIDIMNYIENLVMKIQDNEDILEMNDEDIEDIGDIGVPPKFDNDAHNDELERLQRLALMIKDQLYEMPKPKNEDEDDTMDFENDYQKAELSKNQKVPRWLLTERDIDEIRIKYITWMKMLEDSNHPNIGVLKEAIKESGYTTKLFVKILSEYFNLTSIMLECTTKDDNECTEMLIQIFAEERFRKFYAIFAEMQSQNIFLSP